ncbi:T cell receptor delta variable 4 [Cricetulus griseus]
MTHSGYEYQASFDVFPDMRNSQEEEKIRIPTETETEVSLGKAAGAAPAYCKVILSEAMFWRSPIFYIFIFCTGVSLDVILEQVDQITVSDGNSAKFYCTVTGGDLKNYQMSWYKKSEDNALILVYKLNNSSTDDLMGNFKGEIDASKSQFILDIEKATRKDTGTYYCGSDIHSAAVAASDRFKKV